MTLGVVIIVALLLVLGFGHLIYPLMRRSQTVVPGVADSAPPATITPSR